MKTSVQPITIKLNSKQINNHSGKAKFGVAGDPNGPGGATNNDECHSSYSSHSQFLLGSVNDKLSNNGSQTQNGESFTQDKGVIHLTVPTKIQSPSPY